MLKLTHGDPPDYTKRLMKMGDVAKIVNRHQNEVSLFLSNYYKMYNIQAKPGLMKTLDYSESAKQLILRLRHGDPPEFNGYYRHSLVSISK